MEKLRKPKLHTVKEISPTERSLARMRKMGYTISSPIESHNANVIRIRTGGGYLVRKR